VAANSSAPDRRPSSAEPLPTPVSRCRDPGAWRVAKTHQVFGSLDAIRTVVEDRIRGGGEEEEEEEEDGNVKGGAVHLHPEVKYVLLLLLLLLLGGLKSRGLTTT